MYFKHFIDNVGSTGPSSFYFGIGGSILQPTMDQAPPSMSSSTKPIGSTWSELNIDLDGLTLSGKSKTRPTQPTMNQMAIGVNNNVTSSSGGMRNQQSASYQFANFK